MRTVHPADMTMDAFNAKQVVAQFEGGAVYSAELDGKFYLIIDESALASILDADDLPTELVRVFEFETVIERAAYIKERGWGARASGHRCLA